MSEIVKKRYSTYPKKKEGKRVRFKEGRFFQRTYEWLKWKMMNIGGVAYHLPCLEK